MKKFIAGVIALSLVCGMSACGSGDSSSSSENTTATTTTTTTMIFFFIYWSEITIC